MPDSVEERKEIIYRAIESFMERHSGNSPTLRELAEITGINSTSIIDSYLNRLDEEGRIKRPVDNRARMIEIPGGKWIPPQGDKNG